MGMTQEQLADAADLHVTHIGGLERGLQNPSYSTLLDVTAALGVRIAVLTRLADDLQDKRAAKL
jgi:transcriptional regulator with XRE-family HTH domain